MTTETDIQGLLDRAAIYDTHMRYFNAADCADRAGVRSCFTDDVTAQYEGRPPVRGLDALIEQIALFRNLEDGTCRISTHFVGNVQFKSMTRHTAQTELNAFAFLADRDGAAVAMRSLRYLDQLRRVEDVWKISARLHTLDWSSQVPASFVRAFAAKVTRMSSATNTV